MAHHITSEEETSCEETIVVERSSRVLRSRSRNISSHVVGSSTQEIFLVDGFPILRVGVMHDSSNIPNVIRYSFANENYDFPYVEEDSVRERELYKLPINLRSLDPRTLDVDEPNRPMYLETYSKNLSLEVIRNSYKLPSMYHVKHHENVLICYPPSNYLGIYVAHLKAGLRFPLLPLVKDICIYWQIPLAQLTPNCIRTILGFIILCKACGVVACLELFRFYFVMVQKYSGGKGRGWFYAQKRSGAKELLHLPSSIHNWKQEFFFMNHPSLDCMKIAWNEAKSLDNTKPEDVDENATSMLEKLNFVWPIGENWNASIFLDGKVYEEGIFNIKKLKANIVQMLALAKEKRSSPVTRRASRSKVDDTPSSGSGVKRKASTRLEGKNKKRGSSPIQANQLFSDNEGESLNVQVLPSQDPKPSDGGQGGRRSGKEPMEATPQVEEYFRPKWHLKDSDCIDDARKAAELLLHLTPSGERERMRSLGLATVESMFYLSQCQALIFGQELLRKGRSDRDRATTLESLVNVKNRALQEGEDSKKKLQEENEVLKKDLMKLKEELASMEGKLQVSEQERIKKHEECTKILNKHEAFVEAMTNKVREFEALKNSIEAKNALFGTGLLEGEMSEMAKRAGCQHFLKTEDGKGLIMRLVDGSVKATLVEAEKAIKEHHPTFKFPSQLQMLLDDESVSSLLPWQEGFNFEEYARSFSHP